MIGRAVALVLGVCLVLAGCATPTDTYPTETAASLQASVLAVSDAAAAGDPAAALTRLDELQASLLDEHARGTVDQTRFDSVSAAIDLVRADLERAIAEQAEIVPEETDDDDNPGNSDKPEKPGKPDKDD